MPRTDLNVKYSLTCCKWDYPTHRQTIYLWACIAISLYKLWRLREGVYSSKRVYPYSYFGWIWKKKWYIYVFRGCSSTPDGCRELSRMSVHEFITEFQHCISWSADICAWGSLNRWCNDNEHFYLVFSDHHMQWVLMGK